MRHIVTNLYQMPKRCEKTREIESMRVYMRIQEFNQQNDKRALECAYINIYIHLEIDKE